MNGLSKWVRKNVVHYSNTREMFQTIGNFVDVSTFILKFSLKEFLNLSFVYLMIKFLKATLSVFLFSVLSSL